MRVARSMSWRAGPAALFTLMVGLAACGGGDAAETPEAEAVADTAAGEAEPPREDHSGVRGFPTTEGGRAGVLSGRGDGPAVAVTLRQGRLELSTDSIGPGPVTFVVTNADSQAHAVEIFHEHNGRWRTVRIGPGGTAEMSMSMASSDYEVYCPLDGHRERGLSATLAVR
jgi:hypothetical protein